MRKLLDAVRDGEAVSLAEANDVGSIADALLRLSSDAKLACQMGQANREWAETLKWERFAREQYQVYEAVLGGIDTASSVTCI